MGTQINETNTDMSEMQKASGDVSPREGVTPMPPAKLQTAEEVAAQSHPQDTGRGGTESATDIKLRMQDHQSIQARTEALTTRLAELEANEQKWQKYAQQQQAQKQQDEQAARQQKLKASMMRMREYKDRLWHNNNSPLAHNPMFKASADAVASALETNDADAFPKIEGIDFFVESAKSELELQAQKDKKAEEERKEAELRAKIKAEMEQQQEAMLTKQLGVLQEYEERLNKVSLPLPPPVSPFSTSTTTTSTPSPVAPPPAAPMDIQSPSVQPMKASADSGMTVQQKRAAMADSFEVKYGVSRSQCEKIYLSASADNPWVADMMRNGEGSDSRSSASTPQRFQEVEDAPNLLLRAQLIHHRGRLPHHVAPLDLIGVMKASMDAKINPYARPYKPTTWTLPNGQRVTGVKINDFDS